MMLLAHFNANASSCDAIQVTASTLNVRSGPSTSDAIVGTAQVGEQYVKVAEQSGWVQFWFDESARWASVSYTTPAVVSCGKVTASSLNVRSGAGSTYGVVGTASLDSLWTVLGVSGTWSKIYYESEQRWVSSAYLNTTGVIAPPPISVSNFVINNNDASTASQFVTTSQTISGSTATEYQISSDAAFISANWTAYVANPSFTLTAGNGSKTVYFRARNVEGRISSTVSDNIDLAAGISSRDIDPTIWFNEYRTQFGSLSQSQVDGINFIMTNMETVTESAYTNLTVYSRQMAYLWATTKHEVVARHTAIVVFVKLAVVGI
jgi:uncharacterized protein YraI